MITITGTSASVDYCPAVPYVIIIDRPGHGPGPVRGSSNWREIAIELRPKTPGQRKCLRWRILDFSIPSDMEQHADIALYKTRAKFESKPDDFDDWGGWGKMDNPPISVSIADGMKTPTL